MRAQVVQVDQQLRLVSSPAYSPLDRDKALAEQNVSEFCLFSLFCFFSSWILYKTAKVQFFPPYFDVSLQKLRSIVNHSHSLCLLHKQNRILVTFHTKRHFFREKKNIFFFFEKFLSRLIFSVVGYVLMERRRSYEFG